MLLCLLMLNIIVSRILFNKSPPRYLAIYGEVEKQLSSRRQAAEQQQRYSCAFKRTTATNHKDNNCCRRRYLLDAIVISSMSTVNNNEQMLLFVGKDDRYNGVIVDSSLESSKSSNFGECLRESLKEWRNENKSTIWFRIYLKNADWVGTLANEGFKFHHAKEEYVTMYKWLPSHLECNVPPYAHTNLGVGGFVLNDDTGEILVVKDKRSVLDGPSRWKLPGGIVDPGENIREAVMREVREETGILTEFESLIGFRHAHGYAFGCSDIYVVARLRPLTRVIDKCEREIADCTWMKLEDYASDPNIVENNRIMAKAMLEYARKRETTGLKLIEGQHPLTKEPVFIYLIPHQA